MIIIDYYNFLYSRFYHITEEIIIGNILVLESYSLKNDVVIFLIFDGFRWKDLLAIEKRTIKYIFSYHQTADEIIIDRFSTLQGKSNILVTNDNKLKSEMKKKTSLSYYSTLLFWQKLDFFLTESKNQKSKKSNLIKTTNIQNDFLDELYKIYFSK